MGSLLYIRLIGYTAGTLLQLFWMVVILGYRRQRNFERVFFFLCLSLFLFYAGSLLALNSQIHYLQPPVGLNQFAIVIISAGLCILPALLLHLHLEYAETRGMLRVKRWKWAVLFLFYAGCFHLAYHRIPLLLQEPHFNFLVPGSSLGEGFAIVLAVTLAWCAMWQWRFMVSGPDRPQRVLGRSLQETAHREMDRVQRLTAEIQQEARQGDLHGLIRFIERRVKDQFEFEAAWLDVLQPHIGSNPATKRGHEGAESFSVSQSGRLNAVLSVRPHGAMLSGEIRAALEFLCEQLPGALDLCRLIEEKLQLERELAERERLAALGQMAASISHNLKNPLGSMKTILQVQLENPEMPESMRAETKMILEEMGRLSTKLNQLLQFSRPAVLGEGRPPKCNAYEVAREVVGVLRPEAERKGVALELQLAAA